MIKRTLTALVLVPVLAGGCGSNAGSVGGPGSPPGLLLLASADAAAAIDSATGEIEWSYSPGLFSPAGNRVFALKGARGRRLVSRDVVGADLVGAVNVPNGFTPAVASSSGRSVALVAGPPKTSPYEPRRRSETHLVVARPESGDLQRFNLAGNFAPEAFSTDEDSLFMIEYLDGASGRYRVRIMRLTDGRVLPVGRLKNLAPESMRGTGRVQVYSPDRDYLYTLYTRQPPNDAHGALEHTDPSMVHAFVHVLNLKKGWAHCIDLPMPFGRDELARILAVAPDGDRLYAVDARAIAVIDAHRLRVNSVHMLPSSDPAPSAAVVGRDGSLYLAAGSNVRVLDGQTFDEVASWPVQDSVRALVLGRGEDHLFVSTRSGIEVFEVPAGRRIGAFPAPGADPIWHRPVSP